MYQPSRNVSNFTWYTFAIFLGGTISSVALDLTERAGLISKAAESIARLGVWSSLLAFLVFLTLRCNVASQIRNVAAFFVLTLLCQLVLSLTDDIRSLDGVMVVGWGGAGHTIVNTVLTALWTCCGFWLMYLLLWSLGDLHNRAVRFSGVLERSLNEIYTFDAETLHFVNVNHGARENLGYSMEELCDLTPLDLKPEFTPDSFAESIKPLRMGNQQKVEFTAVHQRKDGTHYPVEVHLQLMTTGTPLFVAIVLDITKRKQLEKDKEELTRFVETSKAAMTIVSPDHLIAYANESMDRLFGYDKGELVGKSVHILNADSVREEVARDIVKSVEENGWWEGENVNVRKDGTEFISHLSLNANRDKDGKILSYNSTQHDITERKRTERALRESEDRYRILVERNPHGIQVIDATGTITYANPAYQEMLGYTKEELLGKHTADLLELASRRPELREYLSLLVKEQPEPTTYFQQNLRKDGKVIEQAVSWNYSRDGEGNVIGFISIITDITERKQAEADLKRQQYYLTKAQEIGSIGTWDLDIKKNELIWTDENYRVFGVPLGTELTYETFLNCVHPDDRQYIDEKWKAALDKEPYDIEHRLLIDGKTKWVREKAELEFDEHGACVRATGFTQDITERKRAEEALQRTLDELEERVEARTAALAAANEQMHREMAERERAEEALVQSQRLASLGTLAAGIAHEINNPLHGIVIGTEVAIRKKDRADDNQGMDEMLRKIQEEAFRCGRIVKSVLQFARHEVSGKVPDSLADTILRARDLTHKLAADRQVHVRVDLNESLQPVTMNPTEMEQVFVNLISNGIEASEAGGCVIVRSEMAPGDVVRIRVEDRGCGMTPEQVEHMFDPFFTTRIQSGGTGLGLSITHGIVEEHGGTLRAESRPGHGAIFTLELPKSPVQRDVK